MADGNFFRIEHQNVRSHQHRIGKKSHGDIGVRVLADGSGGINGGLIGVCAIEEPLAHDAVEHPAEKRDFGNVALAVERDAFRIKASGKPGRGNLHAASFNAGRILALDECVQIREEEEALNVGIAAVLNGRTDGADVVADMQGSGGVDAGENAFFGHR